MQHLPCLSAVLFLFSCILPGRMACQEPYPHLVRVVGAIRTAALVASRASQPHRAEPLAVDLVLPPLVNRPGGSRRQVLRLSLTERLQVRATGDWLTPGPVATLGVGFRF